MTPGRAAHRHPRAAAADAASALIECWRADLQPKLRDAGIQVLDWHASSSGKQQEALRKRFEREIFPVLTPLAFDPGHPFPHISNLSINLAVVVRDPVHGEQLRAAQGAGRPSRACCACRGDDDGRERREPRGRRRQATFVWIEEVIAANLDLLFPGLEMVATPTPSASPATPTSRSRRTRPPTC